MEETQIRNNDGSIPEEVEKQLQGLPDEVLLAVSSRARRIVYGRRDERRKEGGRSQMACGLPDQLPPLPEVQALEGGERQRRGRAGEDPRSLLASAKLHAVQERDHHGQRPASVRD